MLFWIPDNYSDQQKFDFYSDVVILVVLSCLLGLFLCFLRIGLRNPEIKNVHNFVMTLTIMGCLINRFFCMIYSIFYDYNNVIRDYTYFFYIYYQLPFDLLNISVLAQFL